MAADSYEDIAVGKGDPIPALEVKPQELYHANSFWTISIGHFFVEKNSQNAIDKLRILHLHIFS